MAMSSPRSRGGKWGVRRCIGNAALLYDWDWAGAEAGFRRAIALNPNYASAHHFYSILLMTAGRQAEAAAEIRRARELDPLSLIINDVQGWIYYEVRQYDQAIQQYKSTLEIDPKLCPGFARSRQHLLEAWRF